MLLGKLAIGWSAACALLVAVCYLLVGRGRRQLATWGRRVYYGFACGSIVAAVYLLYLFLRHDFRVEYVYGYSALADGLIYNIAGYWGGQQGTFLLWLAMGAVIGLWLVRRAEDEQAGFTVFYFMLVQIFLLAVLLVKSPFALLAGLPPGEMPADGRGLNPLLQDPWMVIHPPVVFAGFAASAVPFALALSSLTVHRYREWIPRAQPWVIFSVLTLGAGLIMGGYWAYKVLGWGGYWAWDPVENAIAIPWFTMLALMHGLRIENREGSLRRSNLFLAMISFVLIMFGTFLTRSGVLADFSVHSFVDLGLNAYLVVFMLGFLSLGLFWLGYRYAGIKVPEVNKKLASREFMVFLAMLVLAVVSALVLLGTSSPLFTGIWGEPAAVSMDYYNRITFPLAIALAVLLGINPFFVWRGGGTRPGQKIAVAALLSLAGTALAFRFGVREIGYVIFAWAALFACFGNMLYLIFFFRKSWYRAGNYVAHLGFGLLLLGILASSAFSTSRKIELREGDERSALGYDFKYLGKSQDQGGGGGTLDVAVRKGDEHFMAYPRFYWSDYTQGYMRKPHIRNAAWYDLYIAPEEHYAAGDAPGQQFANTLELRKGQTETYDQVEYTFHTFDVGSHTGGSGDMRVTANLTAKRYGEPTESIAPYLELGAGQQRREGPATLSDGTTIRLTRIQADAGAILLEIEQPGGAAMREASLLVLQISRKPLVSLVWLGSIMILAGTVLALYFRSRSDGSSGHHVPSQHGAEPVPASTGD